MKLQLTKKTIDWLKPTINQLNTDDDIFAWHVNYSFINRKKYVVIMNDLIRFSIILYGVKKRDMINPEFIFNVIYNAFIISNYNEQLIRKYFKSIPIKLQFGKSKNRKLIAHINRAIQDATWRAYSEGIDYNNLEQLHITKYLNKMIVGENNYKKHHVPEEKMLEYLNLIFS